MKKLIAVLLAALMCASLLLACGSTTEETTSATTAASGDETTAEGDETTEAESTEDPNWPDETYHAVFCLYVSNDNWPDLDQVKAAVSEMTIRDLNIDCELLPMTFSTYATQVPLMLAGGEQVDVFCQSYPQEYYEYGYLVDLMDYEDILMPALETCGYDDVMASRRNGVLMGLPVMLERTHRYGFAMRTDILNEVGYTADDLEECNWDQVTEIFAAVHEAYPDMTCYDGSYSLSPACNYQDTDSLSDGYGVLDNYGQTLTVTNYYDSDNIKEELKYQREWYLAGYVGKDMATKTDGYESLVKAGNTFAGTCPMKPDSKAEKDDQCGYDMTIFYLKYDMMTSWNGVFSYAIGGTAADYTQAARLLNYAFTSREFNDTINWGVEGVDWVESEEDSNTATYPEGMDASNQGYHNSYGWAYPNERIAHVWEGNESDMYTVQYPAAEAASYRTLAWGFIYDNADYLDDITALDNLKSEYLYIIASGSVEWEDMLDEYNQKMMDSGLQDIIDGKQAQLDAWCEENGVTE